MKLLKMKGMTREKGAKCFSSCRACRTRNDVFWNSARAVLRANWQNCDDVRVIIYTVSGYSGGASKAKKLMQCGLVHLIFYPGIPYNLTNLLKKVIPK